MSDNSSRTETRRYKLDLKEIGIVKNKSRPIVLR